MRKLRDNELIMLVIKYLDKFDENDLKYLDYFDLESLKGLDIVKLDTDNNSFIVKREAKDNYLEIVDTIGFDFNFLENIVNVNLNEAVRNPFKGIKNTVDKEIIFSYNDDTVYKNTFTKFYEYDYLDEKERLLSGKKEFDSYNVGENYSIIEGYPVSTYKRSK